MKKAMMFFAVLAMTAVMAEAKVAHNPKDDTKTIVLVHGAFADGSSWSAVIPLLQAQGYKVVAVQNGLNSLADDVAATKRAIANASGPVVLVGHSWGGEVITEAGADAKVQALVYVAALAPDEGDSAASLLAGYPATPGFGEISTDPAGYMSLSANGVKDDFAQDLPAEVTSVMAVTQGPIAASCFTTQATAPAWKSKKSWYIVAENDRMVQPDMERAMATKIGATVTSLPSSHVPMLSHPADVAKVIAEAAASF
jgi:pimeloyl-ACP methyl ester carboxylesterase